MKQHYETENFILLNGRGGPWNELGWYLVWCRKRCYTVYRAPNLAAAMNWIQKYGDDPIVKEVYDENHPEAKGKVE